LGTTQAIVYCRSNPMLRRLFSFALFVLAVAGCSSKHMQQHGERAFWDWFQANDERLYNFERDQEHTFDLLQSELRKVDKNSMQRQLLPSTKYHSSCQVQTMH
jgi:hypothetical protein